MTEKKWLFGTARVSLPAEQFGLDRDGWVEYRQRMTARDYEVFIANNGRVLAAIPGMLNGWNIVANGESVPFDRDAFLDLPADITDAVAVAIVSDPLVRRSIGLKPSGSQNSDGSMTTSEPPSALAPTSGESAGT